MNKFIQNGDSIELNGIRFTVEEFRKLEPTFPAHSVEFPIHWYSPSENIHQLQGKSTINREIPWADGDRYFARISEFVRLRKILDEGNASEFDAIIEEEHRKRMPYAIARKMEYPSIDELVIAMWEYLVEKDRKHPLISFYEKRRLAVKDKYPKKR